MVIHGDDSLNEHSEDLGLEEDSIVDELNSLRMRLGRRKEGTEPAFEEPSEAQLRATGELDDEPEGDEEEELPPEPGVDKSVALATLEAANLSIRKQVRKRLLEGATREELHAEGYNKSTVSTVASEVKKETGSHKPIGRAPVVTSKGLHVFAKGSPPEAIIEAVEVPDVANGQGVSFEQGLKFGMSLIILGVRVAQELSGIGITQAKPILDMAKSMREGEALAAQNAAGEAAMEAAGMVRESMMPILSNIQRSGGGEGADPVKAMMVRTMEPIMQRLMGSMLGRLAPGTAPLQITGGQGKVDGWTRRSE